jgi:hypothetical protein
MPYYKHRKIELTPRRQADGTWHCPYRIIEFRQTCWAYYQGCPHGSFASREDAAAAALQEAKRIVDSLEPRAQGARFEPGSIGGMNTNRTNRLTFFLPRSRTILNTIKILAWPGMARRERKPT